MSTELEKIMESNDMKDKVVALEGNHVVCGPGYHEDVMMLLAPLLSVKPPHDDVYMSGQLTTESMREAFEQLGKIEEVRNRFNPPNMIEDIFYEKSTMELPDGKLPMPPVPNGLKLFNINGKEVYALNRRNAERKAKHD